MADPNAPKQLQLLGVNDFHGRINANTVKWAGTLEKLTADAGATPTLLVGAGDLIGASEFASAVDDDQPTIDVLNALGLDASAVGNHEFDQGWADLRDDVIGTGGCPQREVGLPRRERLRQGHRPTRCCRSTPCSRWTAWTWQSSVR